MVWRRCLSVVDSDEDIIPLPPANSLHRSSRLQSKASPWISWTSEEILEEQNIPVSSGMMQDDLLQLAASVLGNPEYPTGVGLPVAASSPTPVPRKQAGKKSTQKSSSPPAKRPKKSDPPPPKPQPAPSLLWMLNSLKSFTVFWNLGARLDAFREQSVYSWKSSGICRLSPV